MAKKKIKRNNKYFIGGVLEDFGNWNDKVSDNFMDSSLGKGLGKLGVSSSNLGGVANTAATAIGGVLAGGNESGVGNALQGIGSLASNIPGIGGVIGAGVNMVGGLVNAAFGSKLNKEEIAKVEGQIDNLNSFTSNASDYDALASNYTNMPAMGYFSKDDIGSDGWFSNKAKNKWKELRKEKEQAEQWVQNSLFNNAQNIATNKQQLLEANYTAYGGPINMKYTGTMSPFGNQFDDGGTTEKIYKMPTMQRIQYARTGRIINAGYPITPLGKGYKTLKALSRFRKAFKEKPWDPNGAFSTVIKGAMNDADKTPVGWDKKYGSKALQLGKSIFNQVVGGKGEKLGITQYETESKNEMKYGGDLFTNGVTIIGNGGTHEENPLEGVPMGIDQQGIPNLVEEGEVIFDDYVFSNRLRVSKAARQKYKLRGVTFADAAKELSKESEERPNDSISKNGLEAFMQILMNEQEMVRAKKESNKYDNGGQLDTKTQALKRLREKSNRRGKYSGGEFGGAGASSLFLGFPDEYVLEKDTIYVPYRETFNDAFGKARAAGLDEFMFDNKAYTTELGNNPNNNKAGEERVIEGVLPIERTRRVKKVNGGRLFDEGGDKDSWLYKPVTEGFVPSKEDILGEMEEMYPYLKSEELSIAPIVRGASSKSTTTTNNKKSNLSYLRKAPVFMSGLAAVSDLFSNPDYSAADRVDGVQINPSFVKATPLGNYLSYRPLDREFYLNKLDANTAAGRRAVMNTSGGNRAAALAGILATDYNYGNQLGDLARKAEEYNQAQRERVAGFNRQTNMFNSEQSMKEQSFNASSRDAATRLRLSKAQDVAKLRLATKTAYDTRRSNNLNNFITNLGSLGQEEAYKEWLDNLADKEVLLMNTSGEYVGKKKCKGGKLNRRR